MNCIVEETRTYITSDSNQIIGEISYEKVDIKTYNIYKLFIKKEAPAEIKQTLIQKAKKYIQQQGFNVMITYKD